MMQNDKEQIQDTQNKTQAEQLNERTRAIGQQQSGGSGEAAATAREVADESGPSNSGDAGFGSSGSPAQEVSEERMEQMSHADGSREDDHNPDV